MGAITPSILMDLESRMEVQTENEYTRLTSQLWWQTIARTRTTGARRDVLIWLLTTAQIRDEGKGGNISFDDLLTAQTEIEVKFAGSGLKLTRAQLEDTDGGGMDLAAEWSAQIGAYMAYWPQERTAEFVKNAHTSMFTSYDGLPYFATNHPVNPYNTGGPTYSNWLTGYPIDDSVSTDTAFQNLSRVYSAISSYKMPNGVTPRFLRPKAIITGPRLFPRAVQLQSAKFLAQAAGSGAASADVEGLIKAMGYSMPVQADELSGFGTSGGDKTYFVACEQLSTSKLGAVIYTEREAFHLNYYGAQAFPELDRRGELEYHVQGRNVTTAGHPYLLVRVDP